MLSDGFFFDWLTAYQVHPRGVSRVGDSELLRVDLETGDVTRGRVVGLQVDGSYSSELRVSCDGYRVEVSGNPSRFGRPDNLFGLASLDQCFDVFNRVLRDLGLPPFTKVRSVSHRAGRANERARRVVDGAVITRLDITRNHAVGHGNVAAFIRGMSTQTIGERSARPFLYQNDRTVDWYRGSRFRYVKLYDKSHELIENTIKKRKFRSYTPEHQQYIHRLARFCSGKGVVREEHSFKSKWLERKNANLWGLFELSVFDEELKCVSDAMSRCVMTTGEVFSVGDQLLHMGVVKSRQAANATENYFYRWLHGERLPRNRQFYEHKKRLKMLGVDIALPLDISKQIPKIVSDQEISVGPVDPPKWYHMPGQPFLQLVA